MGRDEMIRPQVGEFVFDAKIYKENPLEKKIIEDFRSKKFNIVEAAVQYRLVTGCGLVETVRRLKGEEK